MEAPIATAYCGRKHKVMTLALAVVSIALLGTMAATEGLADLRSVLAAATLGMILGCPIVVMFLEFWFVRVDVSRDCISCQSPWRRDRVIPMADVTGIDFAVWAQWYRVHTNSHGTIRLHGYLLGLYDVLDALESAGHSFPRVRHVR
ncbi:hypothetical protein CA13_08940 [Planctomycetes bacterium CA13]|uniref:PH domain-containing protein n=1 Tax=Novipirellula herctigrandis TaxID=2527986 RepID=A0A5C5YWV3_9BACT|nr:hypothetical protein CA13_08940 [Planctomycetes bacterium CA13]